LIGRFTAWLKGKLSPASPELSARLARIDAWIASMPLSEARERAFMVLANAEWFETRPAQSVTSFPSDLPEGVRELFGRYGSVRGRNLDLRFDPSEVGPSHVLPELTRVGYNDSHVELCCRGTTENVLKVANDVSPAEAIEADLPSVFHAILHAAAIFEYVSPPEAAV
jgi:hypothetical protein